MEWARNITPVINTVCIKDDQIKMRTHRAEEHIGQYPYLTATAGQS